MHKVLLYLVVDDNVVFGCHVISDVVVDDEPEQPVEEREIDLLVHLLEVRLQHDVTLALTRVPHILQVVDTYTNNTVLHKTLHSPSLVSHTSCRLLIPTQTTHTVTQNVTLALTRVPHILQVVDTYTNNTHCYTKRYSPSLVSHTSCRLLIPTRTTHTVTQNVTRPHSCPTHPAGC